MNKTYHRFDHSKLTKSSCEESAYRMATQGTDSLQKSIQSAIDVKKSNLEDPNITMIKPKFSIQMSHQQSRNKQMTPNDHKEQINLLTISKSKLESSLFKKYSTSSNIQDDGWNPYGKKQSVDQRIALFAQKNKQRLNSLTGLVEGHNIFQKTQSQIKFRQSSEMRDDSYQLPQAMIRRS